MICKGYECSLEAGLQVLLQTYIQMRTGWLGIQWWNELTKAYMELGGTVTGHKFDKKLTLNKGIRFPASF